MTVPVQAPPPQGQDSFQRCPFCFTALPRDSLLRFCPVGTLAEGSACAGAVPALRPRSERPRCPDHPTTELIPRCHNSECDHVLPARWNEVRTTCLAMAGTRTSGKTVYIAVTADLLIRWGHRHGMTITHYDRASEESFQRRFGDLHEPVGRLLSSTVPEGSGQRVEHQEPVLLRIQRPGMQDHVLVIRDVAGEDLQNPAMDARIFRFLTRADGLILMIDARSLTQVRNALVGVVETEGGDFNPDSLWGNLQSLMFSVNGDRARLIPVALTISKFDLVHLAAKRRGSGLDVALSARGSRMWQDPSLALTGFDQNDSDLLDQEVRSLLAHLGVRALMDRLAYYERTAAPIRTFAVSSLGHPPAVGKVAAQGKTPFRCLDPILWMLSRASLS